MNNKVLVVVAHSDDEAIGCGGTLLKHRDAGDEIQIIFMTNGIGARSDADENEEQIRQTAKENSCQQLGVSIEHSFDFPDNGMDQIALIDIVKPIESIISHYQPNIIYTHHGGDLNIDHRIVHQAVITACRPQPTCSIEKILAFEVSSSTEWSSESIGGHFLPTYYSDISTVIDDKKALLCHYEHEMRPYPHSRSIEAILNLNKLRGNHMGLHAAEAFMLIREIIRT